MATVLYFNLIAKRTQIAKELNRHVLKRLHKQLHRPPEKESNHNYCQLSIRATTVSKSAGHLQYK